MTDKPKYVEWFLLAKTTSMPIFILRKRSPRSRDVKNFKKTTNVILCNHCLCGLLWTPKGRFLDLLVNWSVSKSSVNCNSLVKFVRVSEQNLDWPLANWMVNYSCLATMRTAHFCLAQAGVMNVMNINERKCSSANCMSQPGYCGLPFCPFMNGFCSKRLLECFEVIAIR